ncbi:MAG: DEAD/DEAH box helicase, partial [Nocardia sp.]|nr:DEAD/DEAH box helicase [Nocardia sp.]
MHSLRREGLEHAFPIQAAAIPDVLAGRDVLGRAATGSGKTLAFGLPMLVRLRRGASPPRRPRAVVLAPTRELALQIEQALDESAVALGLRTATAVGGMPIRRQADQLGRGVDLLVATPGRLADLIARQALALDAVRVAAVDEADHMSQLGFIDQVRAVLDRLPRDCQHLLFSATLDDSVDGLVRDYLDNPVRHAVETPADQLHDHPDPVAAPPDSSDRSGVAHHVLRVRTPDKRAVITEIAARDGRTLLFVRTQYAADKLARRLREAGVG